eukprot:CAMPEP_0206169912 /NCGR_PEP_ID=MMETSP1474-20131121/37274_1 /ASSEMBLY_ACC=CAM_ASM_001110 /TAXON_ID=97495 /ORGANISM="Imantonia sp., Strain RCC918" /LENGTH=74 /DNA_ID=CAMNT_0053576277 /DNA_START=166 /DNA_END=390 /DNA_ORIENTATION=+
MLPAHQALLTPAIAGIRNICSSIASADDGSTLDVAQLREFCGEVSVALVLGRLLVGAGAALRVRGAQLAHGIHA